VRRVDPTLAADLDGQLRERLAGRDPQPLRRRRVHHRCADPADHVAAEGLLLVEHRGHRDRGAGDEVEQRRHDRGGAEVERDRVSHQRGVARLDVDEVLVDDYRGDLEVRLPEHPREPAQDVQVGAGFEVVDGGEQPRRSSRWRCRSTTPSRRR
jgi:hypothetical protein